MRRKKVNFLVRLLKKHLLAMMAMKLQEKQTIMLRKTIRKTLKKRIQLIL